ncbi:MAG: hypothetical protein GC186_16575 [Rhodobacteraceae bacterium]|nr:hypothetical protein [Paracoccaceae bacterium]
MSGVLAGPFRLFCAISAIGLAVGAQSAGALSVSLGGVSVSVGGSSGGGLGVGASVGGSNGVNANVGVGGSTGLGVNASVGGATGVNAGVSAAQGTGLGVNASVGGATGLNVNVGVAQTGITASVSGGSSSGTSSGGSSSSSGTTPSTVTYTMPDPGEVQAARHQICGITGNSEAYNGQVLFGSGGRPIGVIHAAWIGPDLMVGKLAFATLASFVKPMQCVTITVKDIEVGRNGIRLPIPADEMRGMIPPLAGH